jgi:hypothetical protein
VRANHPDTDGPDWFYAGWSEVFDARPEAEDNSPLDALIRSLPALLSRLASEEQWVLWIELDRLLPPWDVRQDIFEAYLGRDDDEKSNRTTRARTKSRTRKPMPRAMSNKRKWMPKRLRRSKQ